MTAPRSYALRLQLTRRCQLRCGYCRPGGPEEVEPATLGVEAIVRIVRALANLGVDRVRLTGGEPLLRADVCEVVAALRRVPGLREVNLTTNADRLAPLAAPLRAAGLTRINVHIDSLDRGRFAALTGGGLDRALEGLHAAVGAGLSPKVNVVVQRGANDDEVRRFCALARELGIAVRFIELMDTGIAPETAQARFVAGGEIAAQLERLGARRLGRAGPAPAIDYLLPDGARVGIIASETASFCDECDRLRLSADGTLRTCLYSHGGVPLGRMLAAGASHDELVRAAREHIAAKASMHPSRRPRDVPALRFSMASVGG